MRTLFLTDNFVPETNAPAYRTYEHCKQWAEKGCEVTVITCAPNFPKGRVYDGYKNKLYQTEIIHGIKVIRVWSFISKNEGFVKRLIDFLSFMVTSFIVGLFIKTDVIIATSPQFFTAISGRWLAFWKRKKWIMEVRDLWPESVKVVGVMGDNLIIKYFEWVEKRLYRSSDKIITVTNYMKNFISNKLNTHEDKVYVIRNGVDYDKFTRSKSNNSKLRDDLNFKNKILIGYIGTHGMAHGLDFILHSAKCIKDERIHFLFIGDGAEKSNLLKLKDELELNNVTFLPSVSKDEVIHYLEILDYGLVNLIKSTVFEGALPSKMNELIAMELPILLGVKGEAKQFIEKYRLGVSYEPENRKSFLEAIDSIIVKEFQYDSKRKELQYILDRRILANKMLDIIKQ